MWLLIPGLSLRSNPGLELPTPSALCKRLTTHKHSTRRRGEECLCLVDLRSRGTCVVRERQQLFIVTPRTLLIACESRGTRGAVHPVEAIGRAAEGSFKLR